MTKKRTTAEEKRTLLLSLFKETEDVYNLKELEKLASREKGIPMASVKDTLQQLLDDNQVEEGKIGSQIYYWLFTGKATADKRLELNNLIRELDDKQKQLDELEDKLSKIDPTDFEDNDDFSKRLNDLKERLKSLEQEFKNTNQAGEIKELVNQLNEWTENLFLIKKYIKNKLYMDEKVLDKEYGIPADLDFY